MRARAGQRTGVLDFPPRPGSLPPPLPHCTAGSDAAVPPQPACRSPGSSRSPPSWSQGQQGEREDTIRSGRLRREGKRSRETLLRPHAVFVLSSGKAQALLGAAGGGPYSSSRPVLQCQLPRESTVGGGKSGSTTANVSCPK